MYLLKSDNSYVRWDGTGVSLLSTPEDATKWKDEKIDSVVNTLKNNKILKGTRLTTEPYIHSEVYDSGEDKKYDINEYIDGIHKFVSWMEKRKVNLHKLVEEAEMEIMDINHAIEFQTLNVVEGYKLYKMLHEVRRKRREYKNEIQQIEFTLGTSLKSSCLTGLKKSMKLIDNKVYMPRINKELFKNIA